MGKHRGEQYWRAHLQAIVAQGVSVAAYARREGIAQSSLWYWRRRLGVRGVDSGQPGAGPFVAVRIAPGEQAPACAVVLEGLRIEFAAAPPVSWLAQLAASLAARR